MKQGTQLKGRSLDVPGVLQADISVLPSCRGSRPCGGVLERRTSSRFQLRLPVLTQWNDVNGQLRYGGGFSRDICVRGVFVLSSDAPPNGKTVTVTVILPNPGQGNRDVQLRCVGSVVRVEHGGRNAGYAVQCDFSGIEKLMI